MPFKKRDLLLDARKKFENFLSSLNKKGKMDKELKDQAEEIRTSLQISNLNNPIPTLAVTALEEDHFNKIFGFKTDFNYSWDLDSDEHCSLPQCLGNFSLTDLRDISLINIRPCSPSL
jgi:hypothetical protein